MVMNATSVPIVTVAVACGVRAEAEHEDQREVRDDLEQGPARGRRRRLRRAGPLPAVPGRPAAPRRAGRRSSAARAAPRRRGGQAVDARRARRRGLRRRDDVPLQRRGHGALDVDAIREPPRIDRRVGPRRRRRAGAQGPRPQRAAGRGGRLRPGRSGRSAGSASRTSTTRRATSARPGRPRSPPPSAGGRAPLGARPLGGDAPPTSTAPALGVVAVAAGDGLAAIFREFGVAAVVRGGQIDEPQHRRAARGDRRRRRPRGHGPAQQPERRPRGAPGRRHGRSAGRRRPDPQRRRGLRGAPRPRPEPRRRGQRRPDDRGRAGRSRPSS